MVLTGPTPDKPAKRVVPIFTRASLIAHLGAWSWQTLSILALLAFKSRPQALSVAAYLGMFTEGLPILQLLSLTGLIGGVILWNVRKNYCGEPAPAWNWIAYLGFFLVTLAFWPVFAVVFVGVTGGV